LWLYVANSPISLYTCSLAAGVSGGIILSGLITITHSWRYIYYVAAALIGGLTLLVIFTLPETSFIRNTSERSISTSNTPREKDSEELNAVGHKSDQVVFEEEEHSSRAPRLGTEQPKQPYFVTSFRPLYGKFSEESIFKIAYRPIILLVLPPILWATLSMSVTIGFLVAISSNFASAFAEAYGFAAWQSGLCFISGLIGTLAGILGGGYLSDWVADYFTRRNGGMREPEMRLPAINVALICSPLALVLYGCGIEYRWHWMVPTIGLGLCKAPLCLPQIC